MSRSRAQSVASVASVKAPHSVSLKVLRLSKPSLAYQHPLPRQDEDASIKINSQAALAYDDGLDLVLSPLLKLPATFGLLFNGETFACALALNNELPPEDSKTITEANIIAEISSPAHPQPVPIDLGVVELPTNLESGQTLQRIVKYDLREEGAHNLAVTITYLEDGNLRTFRKIYQFLSRQLLSVRTKLRALPSRSPASQVQYALEAQLENLSGASVVLQAVNINVKPHITAKSLNEWDHENSGDRIMLNPGDVVQAAYLLTEHSDTEQDTRETRPALAQLAISWRGNMGEAGHLSTGWLTSRRR